MAKPDDGSVTTPTKLFPPWSGLLAIFMVLAAYLGGSIVGELLLGLYGHLQHWNDTAIENWLTHSTVAQFASTVLVYGLMALVIYVFCKGYKVSFRALGLVRPKLRDPFIAIAAAPVYILAYVVLESVAKVVAPSLDINQEQQIGFSESGGSTTMLLVFVSLVVLPPLVEELIMRGFLFTSMLKRLSFIPAAVITSIVFAAGHLQFGSGAPPLWVAAIDTFTLSIVLCYLRYKTGSLWPGIFLHGLKNGIAFLLIFVFHVV